MSGRIHVGRRIAALRATHGDSLRAAAERTGISHTTIGRIENGQATASFHSTLRKIAEGYGVTIEYLMTRRDPCRDFLLALRCLSPEERSRLYFTSALHRTRLLLQFLITEYPEEFPLQRMAEGLGMDPRDLERLLDQGEDSGLPDQVISRIGDDLARLTGISPHWFRSGYMVEDLAGTVSPESFTAFVSLMKKAMESGVRPEVLEMAIDMLILKYREAAPASQPPVRSRPS